MVPDSLGVSSGEISGAHYHRKVTVQVKQGIKNCGDGGTITYWERGGKVNGVVYEHMGFQTANVGDSAVIFITPFGNTTHIVPVEDSDGTVTAPGDWTVERRYNDVSPAIEVPTAKLPMQEYIELVKKVVREKEG